MDRYQGLKNLFVRLKEGSTYIYEEIQNFIKKKNIDSLEKFSEAILSPEFEQYKNSYSIIHKAIKEKFHNDKSVFIECIDRNSKVEDITTLHFDIDVSCTIEITEDDMDCEDTEDQQTAFEFKVKCRSKLDIKNNDMFIDNEDTCKTFYRYASLYAEDEFDIYDYQTNQFVIYDDYRLLDMMKKALKENTYRYNECISVSNVKFGRRFQLLVLNDGVSNMEEKFWQKSCFYTNSRF